MNRTDGWSAPLVTALVIGFALRLYFVFATPVGSASVPAMLSSYNDELAHVNYIEHVAQTGKLPTQVESIQAENALTEGTYENYQPPLYYAGAAKIAQVFGLRGTDQSAWAGRLLDVPLFAIMLMLWMAIGTEVRLSPEHVRAGAIFLSLNGVIVRFTSVASNDTLFWVFAGAMMWTTLRMWNAGTGGNYLFLFALLAIGGLYTKLTILLLLPLPLLVLVKSQRSGLIAGLVLTYALVGMVTGPLWMRNVAEFGSWLPLNAGFGLPEYAIPPWESIIYAIRSFVFPWSEFWRGWIGMALMLPALAIVLLSVIDRSLWRKLGEQPVLPLAFALTLVAFVWLNIRYRQAEARYLFAAWPFMTVAACRPLRGQPSGQWLLLIVLLLPYALFLFPLLGI